MDPKERKALNARSTARRRRMIVNRARNWQEAETWDLDFWQSCTPEERLSAYFALREDVRKAQKAAGREGEW